MSFTKLDYCQYLLSSQVNYTLTNLADHLERWSHDTINRYLKGEKLSPRLLWEQVEPLLEFDSQAYLIFDDTVLDKSYGPHIEVARRQWSGNEKRVIQGIGVVSCVYVDPETKRFWVIDYRIFDPNTDGKSKLDHVEEMLRSVEHREIPFEAVLMDTWYATKELMLLINGMGKTFYCPLRSNRQVDDSGGERPYQRADTLDWSDGELRQGKLIKIKGFPKNCKVKLFRVVVTSRRTEWIVTNDLSFSRFHAGHSKGVCRALEDRGVSSGGKAVDGDRELPVSQRAHPTKSHRVCIAGVGSSEEPGLPERAEHLPN